MDFWIKVFEVLEQHSGGKDVANASGITNNENFVSLVVEITQRVLWWFLLFL